ncbi:MAG TPA: tetratricopeptide repeat protein, partial [Gemmataceae bacterium]|nr:tetratricopeptide repeat protein [Gemmataceae bacterium]
RENLEALQGEFPDDGEVASLLGQAHEGLGNHAAAKDSYEKAVAASPNEIANYQRLANLLRRQPDLAGGGKPPRDPDAVMDQMVAANEGAFRAHLARWDYLTGSEVLARWRALVVAGARADAEKLAGSDAAVGRALKKAEGDVARALELAPDEADVLLAASELEQARGKLDPAREHLRRGRRLHPDDPRLCQALAALEGRAGRRAEALACLREGVKTLQGRAREEVRWTLANLLLDGGDADEAREEVARLERARYSAAGLEYLRARLLMHQGQWAPAARMLERARAAVEAAPAVSADGEVFLAQVNLHLGRCYKQLNEPARQVTAFERLVARSPGSPAARLQLASAHAAMGRLDEALEQCRQALALPNAPPQAAREYARLLIVRNLRHNRRDWDAVREALDRADRADPGSTEVVLLRAEALAAQDRPDDARKLLEEARGRQPKQVALYAALAALADRRGDRDAAGRVLDEAAEKAGDSVDLRLARARHAAGLPRGARDALAPLAADVEQFTAADQARLLEGLAAAHVRAGDPAGALRLWKRLADRPDARNDLRVQFGLAELALQTGDEAAVRQALDQVRQIEGGQGTFWRYGEALRLVRLASSADGALDTARNHLDLVAGARPGWVAVPLAKAELEERAGRTEQAIAQYWEAINLGEQDPRVVRQLVQLLHSRQRYREADQVIRRLQKQAPLSPDLQRLAADLALRNRDGLEAARRAAEAMPRDSADYRDHLWLGQVLAASGQRPDDAERSLRRAVELGERVPETWVSLVEFLAARGRKEQAEKEIGRARERLPKDVAPLALAPCWEALGQPDRAREQYEAALAARPTDGAAVRGLAGLLLRGGRLADAEPHLRKLAGRKVEASDADAAWGRRNLAWVLASSGGARRLAEALALVGMKLDEAGRPVVTEAQVPPAELTEEQRARAKVLATRQRQAFRTQAVALFEELGKRQALGAEDQFLLTRLYEARGDWAKARQEYRDLLTRHGDNPLYLARFAQGLLFRRELEECLRCVERLERLEKTRGVEAGTFDSARLRAEYLLARGEGEKAVALLKPRAEREGAPPEELLNLAGVLARLRRTDEALACCDRAWQRCPPESAGAASVAVLRAGEPTAAQMHRVEKALADAAAKHPDSLALLLQLADLRDLQRKYADAEALYRQVLKRDPTNATALNNLSWLLANDPRKAAEALELVNRAIEAHGPRADLLDTRATAYLALGQAEAAVKDLQAVVAEAPSPGRHFQLARAHLKAQDRAAAAKAFAEAKRLGFTPQQMHPLQQDTARSVAGELES